MGKKIAFIIYKIIFIISYILKKITGKSILIWFKEFIEKDSYSFVKILNKKKIFFTPNYVTNYCVNTFYTKEPETLEWIDKFNKNGKIIFWDVGANLGLYSIYAAVKYKNIKVVAFEPSTSNLRILSRNISVNKLEDKISINQLPLSNKKNKFLLMKENKFNEGEAMNSFNSNLNYEGKKFDANNQYRILGTTINFLLKNNILEAPNYVKIDVDGIEHLILSEASILLKNKKLNSICIELNENFKLQHRTALKILKKNFVFDKKIRSEIITEEKFSKVYNYFFFRKNS